MREIQKAFGFSTLRTAQEHLEKLVDAGQLEREPRVARGFRLPANSEDPVRLVPLLGHVHAGDFTQAIESCEAYLPIRTRKPVTNFFALRVQGDSMKDAGILPGDLVIVRRQPTEDSGEIVVALIGEDASIKRLVKKKRRLELHAANSAFQPVVPDPGEVHILGKVVEVRRFLEGRGRL
ncbi:MAG: repressor LexA [Planctomycetes bacterium]|nr:repressor LexA [Planctomycetota bacterium]